MAESGEPLTERELEVVRLAAGGAANKDIAAALFLSPNTVKVHLRNIFTKLEVQSRNELTVLALRNGWVVVDGASIREMAQEPQAAEAPQIPSPQTPRVVPRVAPNPHPLPALPAWRKWVLMAFVAVFLASFVATLPTGRAITSANTDLPDQPAALSATNELLPPGQTTRWFLRAPLDSPRARAASAAIGDDVYLIGGEVNQLPTGDVRIFSRAANVWRAGVASKPTPVSGAVAVAIGQKVFVMGGADASGAQSTAVEMLDTTTGAWSALAPMPGARVGFAAAALDSIIYIFGGRGSEPNPATLAFNPATNTWQTRAPEPAPRALAQAAALGDRVFVVGGYANGQELSTCEAYTPAKNTWESCKPMSIPRASFGLAQIGGSLYAVGGGVSGFVGFSERYDPAQNVWTPFETPFTGDWRNIAVVSFPTEFYVIGGYSNNRRLPFNYAYEALNNKMYLPSLSAPRLTPAP